MQKVVIYTAARCPYCHMARELLASKGAVYEEIDVTDKADVRAAMTAKAGGRRTVPQIWVGDVHVGGCDDLHKLDRAGKLDTLLRA